MAVIQNEVYGGPGEAIKAKAREAIDESERAAARREKERIDAEKSFAPANSVLSVSPERLAELKAEVMSKNPALSPFLEKSDPAKSPVLRSLMASIA